MKKWVGVFIFAMCLLVNSAVAKADVIWKPAIIFNWDVDKFVRKNANHCVPLDRNYVANGPDGEVILYKSPVNAKEKARLQNDVGVLITWKYEDENGNMWGYCGYDAGGWVPLAYMNLIYDHISFEEEYGEECVLKEGQAEAKEGEEYLHEWEYPGATSYEKHVMNPHNMPEYDVVYEDKDGRTWGYCRYYQGCEEFWMCLDDVSADYKELYGEEPTLSPKIDEKENVEYDGEPIVPSSDRNGMMIGLAVAGVVAVTSIALIGIKKMKKGM